MSALQKQSTNINFSEGLDTQTDPNQVMLGKMLSLVNSVFTKAGQLTKRNGFDLLPALPDTSSTFLSTHNSNLLALGNNLQVLSSDTRQWFTKGEFQDVDVNVVPLVRTTSSQTTVDSAIAPNNAVCTVYLDSNGAEYYSVSDLPSGEIIVPSVALPSTATSARVAALGSFFIVTYLVTSGPQTHLAYIAIPSYTPQSPRSPITLATDVKTLSSGYDIVVANNNMYFAYESTFSGGAVRVSFLDNTLLLHVFKALLGHTAQLMTLAVDNTGNTPTIYITFWQSSDNNAYTASFDQNLNPILTPTLVLASTVINEITSAAQNLSNSIFYQVTNTYSYSSVRTDYVLKNTISYSGTVSSPIVLKRSVGLGSKAFIVNSKVYLQTNYAGSLQPTYFLIDEQGNEVAKTAYSNGPTYAVTQVLPQVNVTNQTARMGYLFKDLLAPVNKAMNAPAVNGVYSQTGINLATYVFNSGAIATSELAGSLHITGGILWQYDGVKPVEHGFFLYPEDLLATPGSGGSMSAQTYFYQWTYEWTDAGGNLNRSAPSIPYEITLTSGQNKVVVDVPTLRLTYKDAPNDVRLVGYRWSQAQQVFYQITSISAPVLNNTTVDFIAYTDTLADSSIIGNTILYTTGGVLENIQAPSSTVSTLYKSRLFLVDAEDQNLLWYSKQVIENTPVEMTDLQTIYVAPTTAAQGNTGPITALSAMDDKLIIFKKDAIYYLTGNGPDVTGANNDFSDPTYITGTVGCANQNSLVIMPQGLMFQSDKGIWLLGRDLSTQYIGSAVQNFNTQGVLSAIVIPGTNTVRFTMSGGTTLMYDYYFGQWGEFRGIPGISSTLYQGLHTFINKYGEVLQESVGKYLDGGKPVLMSFTTAWAKFAGLQGFQRAYFFYLLGIYASPHTLTLTIAYDYNPNPTQQVNIQPTNFSGFYGDDPLYGDQTPYGGEGTVEQWRVFLQQQKCQSVQISLSENFDSTLGTSSGAGLTLSGINLVYGVKKGYTTLAPSKSVG